MERLMFTMRIRAGQEAEYERRHAAVWPELMADLRAAGWTNYSLFRRDSQVCAYVECHPDVATALAAMAGSAANDRWATWFDEVLEELVGPDGELIRLPEVWHLPESARSESVQPESSERGQ
jgi:L-rhamnose mutarotase